MMPPSHKQDGCVPQKGVTEKVCRSRLRAQGINNKKKLIVACFCFFPNLNEDYYYLIFQSYWIHYEVLRQAGPFLKASI